MLLVLDNYDSFTFNLVQYFGALGAEPQVVRNDHLTVDEAIARKPKAIIISPGPCTPREAGISVPLVRAAGDAGIPLLGVCLGHQSIGEAFGGEVVRADRLMHGKFSTVVHQSDPLFSGVPDRFQAMRYHSLVVRRATLPEELVVTAWTTDRDPEEEIMAVRHRTLPIWGVQFHPESVGTPVGRDLVRNFLKLAGFQS